MQALWLLVILVTNSLIWSRESSNILAWMPSTYSYVMLFVLFCLFVFFSCLLSHFPCSRTFTFLKNMRLWMASWIKTWKLWAKNPIRSLGICLWNLNSWGKLHIHRAVTEKYPRVIMQILTLWLANDRFQAITVKGMAHYAVISKLTCTNQTSTVNQNARK